MKLVRPTALTAAAALVVTGLAAAGAAATTTVTTEPAYRIKGPLTGLEATRGLALDPSGSVFVGDLGADSGWGATHDDAIRVFAPGTRGDVGPERIIAGASTGIGWPRSIDVDSAGYVYTVNQDSDTITVHTPTAHGNVAPVRTITDVNDPMAVVVGLDGRVYVGSWTDDAVLVFAPGADGPAVPERRIEGALTGLDEIRDVVLGADGSVWVVSSADGRVSVFAPGADGAVEPVRVIEGPSTLMTYPVTLDLDSSGNVYVGGNGGANHVVVFGPRARGDAAPLVVLDTPPSEGVSDPWNIELDADRNLFITNEYGDPVTVHAPLVPFTAPSTVRSLDVRGKKKAKKRQVTWAAPADDGGQTVAYRVTVRKKSRTLLSRTTTKTSLTVTRKHLRSGKHRVQVVAFNETAAAGAVSVGFKVKKIKPAKVRKVRVKGKKSAAQRTVRWKQPRWTGGAKIKRYRVVVKKGKRTVLREVVRGTKRSLKVAKSDLRSGKHKVRVRAKNKKGWGKAGKDTFRVRR